MTPIEIIEAYNRGDKLESLPYNRGLKRQDVSSVGVAVVLTGGSTYISYGKSDIPWIRIKRETFGFFKAINLMREGKVIGKDGEQHHYKIDGKRLMHKIFGDSLWIPVSGYPLDWPDAQDFYEVEG